MELNNMHYVLDKEGNVKEEPDLMKWAEWMEQKEIRRAGHDVVGDYYVSTVFLGLDYSFSGEGEPILFETMVFENKKSEMNLFGKKRMYNKELELDGAFERYTTRKDAEEGHERIVKIVENHQK